MKLKELTYLLQHPEAATTQQANTLFDALQTYPYFQPIKAIYLKALKQKGSYKYNNALKTTAAYTTDRSVLFDYITSELFNQNEISKQIQQSSEHIKSIEVNDTDDISLNKSVIIDDALKAHIKATEGVLNPKLFKPKTITQVKQDLEVKKQVIAEQVEEKSEEQAKQKQDAKIKSELEVIPRKEVVKHNQNIETPLKTEAIEKELKIGEPLHFNKSENHSFSEWLKITTYKPIEREIEQPKAAAPLEDKLAIIDRFIEENPKIKPVSNQNTFKSKLIVENDELSESLMTETLARIYLEQKNYDKAIQAYKILSLKYPEKSSFFADQLKLIQELKDNI